MRVVSIRLPLVGQCILSIAVVFLLVSTGTGQTSGIAGQAAFVSEFEVNGLKVLVKRRESAPTVAAGLFVRGGARNLRAENAGIENFMLDAVRNGSRKFPREVVRRELARMGSSVGASVNNDYGVLSLASTREKFDKSWEIFTDLVVNPTFNPKDVERVREAIITGLREEETNADNFLQILQYRIIYDKHPYSNDVRGTLETVSKMRAQDLRDYHKKVMQTSQLLLVVVGDIDPDDLKQRVRATLGKLPRGDYNEKAYPALDFSKPTVDIVERSLPTNYVRGVFDAPPLSSSDYSAMRVAMTILQSRVFQEVRVKRQLSYAPNAELNSLSANTAHIYVTATDANQAVRVMLNEIKNLKTRQINGKYINSIAGHFLTLYYLDQQTNGSQARELAKYELIGGGWRNSFEFLNRLRRVTPVDVQQVAQKYMKNIRFVVIGNPADIDKSIFLQSTDE